MRHILLAALDAIERRIDFALAKVIRVHGSSPRKAGATLTLMADGRAVGTVGGGEFEARTMDLMRHALATRTSHRVRFTFDGEHAGSPAMICGGEAEVFVEFAPWDAPGTKEFQQSALSSLKRGAEAQMVTAIPIGVGEHTAERIHHWIVTAKGVRIGADAEMPAGIVLCASHVPQLYEDEAGGAVFVTQLRSKGVVAVFGAGHVGAGVAKLAAYVDFHVVVVDDRIEFANKERLPEAEEIIVADSFQDAMKRVKPLTGDAVVIVTRGHEHDKTVLAAALRTPASYVGMIGSRRKIRFIYDALLQEGFTDTDLDRVSAPIGLDIGGETPEEIAVSIVAELIAFKARSTPPELRSRSCAG